MGGDMKEERKPTVVHSQQVSKFKSTLALLMWLSLFHVNVALLLLAIFVLPSAWGLMLLALLLMLMFIPLYENSFLAVSVAKFICKHGAGHFPITLVMEDKEALELSRAYLFAVEPHSVLPIGMMALCNHTGYLPIQKIKALASSAVTLSLSATHTHLLKIFITPILRHIWAWLGLVPASRKVLSKLLSDGYSCALVLGGIREMLYLEHDREVVYLKQRFGFVRVAIETGSPLVPCFMFGQTRIYKWWKPKGKVYNQISRALRFAPIVFWGMFGSPIPFPHPVYVVVGKPMEVEKNQNPSEDEVSKVHAKYLSSLQELYEKHKVDAGYKGVSLDVY